MMDAKVEKLNELKMTRNWNGHWAQCLDCDMGGRDIKFRASK